MTELEYESVICGFLEKSLKYQKLDISSFPTHQKFHFASYLKYVERFQQSSWQQLCKKAGSIDLAKSLLSDALSDFLDKFATNAVVPPNSAFKVKDQKFNLFSLSSDNNLYEYSRQTTLVFEGAKSLQYRPDVLIWINGIPMSLIELKFEPSGQNAGSHGIAQLLSNYRGAASLIENSAIEHRPNFYDRLVHVITMDSNSLYVCRSLEKAARSKSLSEIKSFFECYSKEMQQSSYAREKGESLVEYCLSMLFKKDSLRHEIGILNRQTRFFKNVNERIRKPRMCQKIAVELTVQDIQESLKHNSISLAVKSTKVHSMLELATGAGKSDIIAVLVGVVSQWKIFDKIVVVTDRIDLKHQIKEPLDKICMSMGTGGIAVPNSVKELQKTIKDKNTSVVLTTIQSLGRNDIPQSAISNCGLKTFILIDEAHRSHNGDNHITMLKSLTGGDHPQSFTYLLGLTATPQSVTRDKFKLLYRYSFEQAIADGIILDPAPHMYDYIVVPSEAITTEEAKFIYLEEDRIDKINEHMKSVLKFQMAQGIEPKAMLCCDSVLAANKQFEQLEKTLLTDSSLSEFPLFLYHTSASRSTSEELSPDELIAQFKNLDKGLIVVVDKLQTGYDDPKLNTLFLNKVISGISAVQAVNRVTRKYPGKHQCLIISYADKGGIATIKEAFDTYKYQLTPITAFTPVTLQTLNELKNQLNNNNIFQYFKTHFTLDFSTLQDTEVSALIAQVEDYIKVANNYFINNSSAKLAAWDIQWNRDLKRFLNILNAYSEDETELLKYIDSSSGIEFKAEGLFNGQEEVVNNNEEDTVSQEPKLLQVESTNELFDEASVESWHSYAQLDSVIQTKHMYFKMLKVCIGLDNPTLLSTIASLKAMDTPIVDTSILNAVAEIEDRVKSLLNTGDNTSKEFISRMGSYYVSRSALLFNEFLSTY